MNYLAHLFLAPQDDLSRLGNIMADFMRDVELGLLPQKTQEGIRLHWSVDAFTDAHPIVKDLRSHFSRDRRRFAGVVLDVVFDHFLIKHWKMFTDVPFDPFVDEAYAGLWRHREWMPERMEMVIAWMIKRDWIRSYSEISHVGRALDGLAGRLKINHSFHGAIDEVQAHYHIIERGFLDFFPELSDHVNRIHDAAGRQEN